MFRVGTKGQWPCGDRLRGRAFHTCSGESSSGKRSTKTRTWSTDGFSSPVIPSLMSWVNTILVPSGQRGDYEKESRCDLSCKGNSNKIYCLVTTEEFL